jgi:hypothetical protein
MAYFEDNSISHNVTTVAVFRAWAAMIHKALEEIGMVETGDEGKINLATVELPAINTFAGFEVWRFADARQGAEPIYLKIEYGRAATENSPTLRFTWGTGTNGKGTITNPSAAITHAPVGIPEGNGYIYACNVDGAFALLSCGKTAEVSSSTPNLLLFVGERLRDAEFNPINGFVASKGAAGEQLFSWTVWVEGGWKNTEFLRTSGSPSYKGLVYPTLIIMISPVISAPIRAVLGSKLGVIGSLDTGKVMVHGKERLYMRLPIEHRAFWVGGTTGVENIEHNFLLLHE